MVGRNVHYVLPAVLLNGVVGALGAPQDERRAVRAEFRHRLDSGGVQISRSSAPIGSPPPSTHVQSLTPPA